MNRESYKTTNFRFNNLKPVYRSKLRIFLGKIYFCNKRRMYFMFSKVKLAKHKVMETYAYEYIKHSTPLLRELKNVDMYLQYNKIENIKIAIEKLNNIVINPGETLSYWKLIGKPTRLKGYKEGMVLFQGTIRTGIGGGLCQLSNLIYWMAIHSPLTVVERYRHSYDVFPDSNRIIPFGAGATCVYNYKDLMLRNDTMNPIQLKLWMDDYNLYGELRGNNKPMEFYCVYEREHYIQREAYGKYSRHNILYRKIYDIFGNEVGDEYINENHALMMYEPLLEQK